MDKKFQLYNEAINIYIYKPMDVWRGVGIVSALVWVNFYNLFILNYIKFQNLGVEI